MSLAENLLNSLGEPDYQNSRIAGIEPEQEHIIVGQDRTITVPNSLKTIAVEGDKDIETVTFDCVRYWDGNDLSTFAIYLNYVLPDKTVGTYIPEAITTSEGEDVFHFDWKIKNNITTKSGKISFAITAIKTKQNENGETVVDKQWGSLPNGDCSIALGLDIANVPSEEESSDVVAQLSAILEQIHADVDEWIKTALVQVPGGSTDKAMSQWATTLAIENATAQSKEYTDVRESKINKSIDKVYQQVIVNSKQIENFKKGISEQFYTDSSVAYLKSVPENALPYAEIKKIGGMTYRDETAQRLRSAPVTVVVIEGANLIPYPYTETTKTINGITFTDNGDGSITVNGTATGTVLFAVSNTLKMQDGEYTIGKISEAANSTEGVFAQLFYKKDDGSYFTQNVVNTPVTLSLSSTIAYSFQIAVIEGVTVSNVTVYPMLNKGETALPYAPYVCTAVTIPEVVQAIDGYGEGINANVYNYIGWSKKQFAKHVGKAVFDGSTDEMWLTTPANNTTEYNAFYVRQYAENAHKSRAGAAICDKLPNRTTTEWYNNVDGFYMGDVADKQILIRVPNSIANVAALRTWLAENPLTVYYELATPEVTDISDLLSADNYIEVEGGGSLTFENEYGYDVPSEIEYQVGV
jgi:hypothetical protein